MMAIAHLLGATLFTDGKKKAGKKNSLSVKQGIQWGGRRAEGGEGVRAAGCVTRC